jgi:hypothetical protein
MRSVLTEIYLRCRTCACQEVSRIWERLDRGVRQRAQPRRADRGDPAAQDGPDAHKARGDRGGSPAAGCARPQWQRGSGGVPLAAGGGESFVRVDWVAVPKASRARRANRGRRGAPSARGCRRARGRGAVRYPAVGRCARTSRWGGGVGGLRVGGAFFNRWSDCLCASGPSGGGAVAGSNAFFDRWSDCFDRWSDFLMGVPGQVWPKGKKPRSPQAVSRPCLSWDRSILTGIYLWYACSDHGIN